MDHDSNVVKSLQNSGIKEIVRLRKRSYRDEKGILLIEGYREVLRALENDHSLQDLYFCPDLFQGENEQALLQRARDADCRLIECSDPVFRKIAYRDRPEGLLALGDRVGRSLDKMPRGDSVLYLVAEAIEKPGNLGSILRSADAAGASGVIVCDERTDINNPNTVRASIGTLFTVPVAQADSAAAMDWLKKSSIRIVTASPNAAQNYTEIDLRGPVALVVGAEQVGLSRIWNDNSDESVAIPMHGQVDSLNVANAATLLLFEAVRQRNAR
jgi:TrmH family RNA methyltransferase